MLPLSTLPALLLACLGALLPLASASLSAQQPESSEAVPFDVVVYGATPGGITAAIAAAREGASVVLLEQTAHVGGLSTSGLNRDEGEHMDRSTFGGLSDRFTIEAAAGTYAIHFTGTFAGAAPLRVEVAGKTLPQKELKGNKLSFGSVELPEGEFPLKLIAGKPEGKAKQASITEISFTKL